MRENAAMIELAEQARDAHPLMGTPAGNAPFTQEQMAGLKTRGISISDVISHLMDITIRPSWQRGIPEDKLPPIEPVKRMCPVIFVDRKTITVILPDGRQMAVAR